MQNNEEQAEIKNGSPKEEKLAFVDPKKIIEMAEIKKGERVADFGCGPGYFSLPAAEAVGEEGTVYAFDVLPSAIEALESHLKMNNIDNIISRRANLEKERGTGLEDETLDWVIVKDVLFQNKNKQKILEEAKRVLKVGGKILTMEWNENVFIGPNKDSRISKDELSKIIFDAGFIFKKEADAGDYHYIIIASK